MWSVFATQKRISEMWAPLAARSEQAGRQVYYMFFKHKMKIILIHAPHTRTVAFSHISNVPPMIS